MVEQELITKDMILGDVVQRYPESAMIMMKYGLHCIGCHVAAWETIEQGCMGHGLNKKDIDKLVKDINETVKQKKK